MNEQLTLLKSMAARAYLPAEALSEQRAVLERGDVEWLGAMLYRLCSPDCEDVNDSMNELVQWAALHTDALMSVLIEKLPRSSSVIHTDIHVAASARVGVSAQAHVPPALLLPPLAEYVPPPPEPPVIVRLNNDQKREALRTHGWTCHADIEQQNISVCWENGGKWTTLEDAYEQLTDVPRAVSIDDIEKTLDQAPPAPPPPPIVEPYLTVRDLRAALEGLPGDASIDVVLAYGNHFTAQTVSFNRDAGPHGVVSLGRADETHVR